MKLHKSENKRKAEWTYTKCGLVVNGKYIVKCWKDVTCKICLKRKKKMNEEIILCNGKERKGMSCYAIDINKYVEK